MVLILPIVQNKKQYKQPNIVPHYHIHVVNSYPKITSST